MQKRYQLANYFKAVQNPYVAAAVCSALAFPARPFGHEAAQASRRSVDYLVSRSDVLFDWVTRSDAAADAVRAGQAWGAWIIYGLITGLIAMFITRWLAGRPLSWRSIFIILAVWITIRAFFWNWDNDLQFRLTEISLAHGNTAYGPWPYAGWVGFFIGFALGIILAATPWRSKA